MWYIEIKTINKQRWIAFVCTCESCPTYLTRSQHTLILYSKHSVYVYLTIKKTPTYVCKNYISMETEVNQLISTDEIKKIINLKKKWNVAILNINDAGILWYKSFQE